jgi:hypothetical protein
MTFLSLVLTAGSPPVTVRHIQRATGGSQIGAATRLNPQAA